MLEKWIEGKDVCEEAVEKMKPMPIGLRLVAPIVAAAGLPMIPVLAIEVPLKQMLRKIMGALL